MTRTCAIFALTLAGLLGAAAQADAFCLRLRCLRPLCRPVVPCGVALLGWHVELPASPPLLVPPLPPVLVPPMPPPQPSALSSAPIVSVPSPVPPVAPTPGQVFVPAPVVPVVMTHQDFARVFKPAPGRYEVTLLHPGSKNPVRVCFTLPDGDPQVRVHRRELVFDYGRHEVEIRFALGGRVRVTAR
jgi:hypothetical protein